jgi:hypothetical protein
MVDVRGYHHSTFLRATPAIGLLGEPMSFDRFPSWRLVPSAPWLLDSGLALWRRFRSTAKLMR